MSCLPRPCGFQPARTAPLRLSASSAAMASRGTRSVPARRSASRARARSTDRDAQRLYRCTRGDGDDLYDSGTNLHA